MEKLINKVAQSGLITIDLEKLIAPTIRAIDLSQFLFKQMILKEKLFREELKGFDWRPFESCDVGVYCSTNAIIPHWAYMLITAYLTKVGANVHFGDRHLVRNKLLLQKINNLSIQQYEDKRVIIKGCSDINLEVEAYIAISLKLLPVVRSLMYGEACSTVPVFKK